MTLGFTIAAILFVQGEANDRAEALGKSLLGGKLAETERRLMDELAAKPDDAVRMTLGMTKFLRAIEDYARTMRRFGFNNKTSAIANVPFFRIPVPEHANPAPVRPDDLRAMFAKLVKDLDAAEAVLAPIQKPDWKVVVPVTELSLNVADDGEQPVMLPLVDLLGMAGFGATGFNGNQPPTIVVAFDKSDSVWLRGYCRLLSSLAEIVLAYDGRELFDHSAHLAFAKPVGKHPFLQATRGTNFDANMLIDGISFIHMLRLPLKEPERLKSAHSRLLQMFDLSGKMWDEILAETDNDREWIPSPKQTAALQGVRVNQAMVDSWREFLAESKLLLEGKKLAPFWRDSPEANGVRGINFKKVFYEPRPFDLVLWLQGPGAVPFIEKGPTTNPETWNRLSQVFQGRFMTFFVWWN